ncbi:AT-rich interactive domain-containing protein 4-like [Ipomoea triloba]|uniref:AT-rich interactive domain-containing protein 4-like n=1 Tax=Ipomoea triloba TaxID=35885 RepID=UPI00125E2BCF|nr:AT-rich interactive domain-containing protein 4-like [Ipomoea triloba]XP_031105565.1 AT-rich interactive domain-containing protein 4-like [Ipomoea triloba]
MSVQGTSKHSCSLLAVVCGRAAENIYKQDVADDRPGYPDSEIASSGRLEVQLLKNPRADEFRKALDTVKPNIVFLQGEQLPNDEFSSLVWEGFNLSSEEAVSGLSSARSLTTVYLEIPEGEELAEALQSKGIPYVIYWKKRFSHYAACHFRHAMFSVLKSSSCHTWDAFQLAHASYMLYCALPDNSQTVSGKVVPHILGDPPKIDVPLPELVGEDEEEGSSEALPAIKIYDDDVTMRFLVCGMPRSLDTCLLESLEDGLNAILSIEMRGSKLHNRVSALPPPLEASTFSRGVVTMRCDLSTTSSAHISLLVSGSAQTCFDDQLLENHIKSEIIEKTQLVQAVPNGDERRMHLSEPRRSVSIACGAAAFEVCVKVPTWASQVLRQLAPDFSYRSLVALGVASIQGIAVATFEKEDAERILFFCSEPGKDLHSSSFNAITPPIWLRPPAPSRKRPRMCQETSRNPQRDHGERGSGVANGLVTPMAPARQKLKAAAMRPIPHIRHRKMLPFSGMSEAEAHDGHPVKSNLPVVPSTKASNIGVTPVTHRKSVSTSHQAKQIISLNPLPLKKHECGRSPIHVCSEEEFLKDVMQFLILRGHSRLIPQGGLAEFPDAILNAKRLDLFNLYREVVSRGGFHVGNGINWKGQVFSKMRNHTVTNRMTGVGNTLKRHYETYLLEYELAHDDVDGECCLLCHSSAAGDWVNCGICGEWAHFGCDRRPGLGAFKDYAKTDGLEYICPQCSISNFKKKIQKTTNGYS